MNYGMDNGKERGWILRILEKIFPDPLDVETLKKQLIDLQFLTSDSDMRSNVAYLEKKGLIASEEVGFGGMKRTVVSLTDKGKDLIEGNEPPIAGVDV